MNILSLNHFSPREYKMAKKNNTRDRLAMKVQALQQTVEQQDQDIRWLKREVRKLAAKETKE